MYNLYLWGKVLADYTYGCAVAIARSEEEAIEIITEEAELSEYAAEQLRFTRHPIDPSITEPNPPRVIDLDRPFAFAMWGGG